MNISDPVALIIVGLITAAGAWLTNRQAAKSAKVATETTMRGSIETSRIQTEEQAYQRAKSYYEGVIVDQDRRLAARDQRVSELEGRVDELEDHVEALTGELATAKAALRMRYPDEK